MCSFSYETEGDESREILRDINLEVQAGEVVAVVGSSGAGKSTLVHLIPRFFDVTSGRLLIDGRDVRDITLGIAAISDRRGHAGNRAFQRYLAQQHSLRTAAMFAKAGGSRRPRSFRARLHHGISRRIRHDDWGAWRSSFGGERQRIAIARAMLKNAPILILDEATSALDSESEALVQSALQNLMIGRTVFVIAHRLSTVRRADRIVVLENGTIADIGSHEELMQKLGTYRRLYDLQFMEAPSTWPSGTSKENSYKTPVSAPASGGAQKSLPAYITFGLRAY